MPRSWFIVIVGAALILGAGAGYYYWPESAPPAPPPLAETLPFHLRAELAARTAAEEAPGAGDALTLAFTGNGSTSLRVTATNKTRKPLSKTLDAGSIYEHGSSRVALMRSAQIEAAPGATVEQELPAVALASANSIAEGDYAPSEAGYAVLRPLLDHLASSDAETIAPGALQTAVLALVENSPVGVFAKFPRLRPEPAAISAGDRFKVETADILGALELLRAAGVDESQLAIGSDPQLKIEAMVDPVSHLAALRYYGITEAGEWSFWKDHLLNGDRTTRHYALYGIGRYYPGIALEMMPRWALETQLQPVMRRSAINSLGATHRAEALGILSYLSDRLATSPELQAAAQRAGAYLEQELGGPADGPAGAVLGSITP